MKITLVQPPLTLKERYGVEHQSGGESIPLGLAYLASSARAAGCEVKIIDAEILHFNLERAAREILDTNPEIVGFTAVSISVDNAAAVAKKIKNLKPNIIAVIGGHHLTTAPKETLELFPNFDLGVVGEGEKTLIELASVFGQYGFDKERLRNINGLIFRDDESGGFIITSPRERVLKLDSLPPPAFDLLPDLTLYSPPAHTVKKFPACTLVTSRGCPGQCVFCTRSVYGNILSSHSAEYMIDLAFNLYNDYGIREIQFRDDNFTVFKARLFRFCELLKEKKLDLVWTALARVDMVDPEMLRAMKGAGCWQIWYGLESGNNEILKLIKKNTTKEKIAKAVNWTKRAGMDVGAFFILGHPGETKETMRETIDFALSLSIDEFHSTFMTPLPGSELSRIWPQYGTFDNDWKKFNEWKPVFVPNGLTKEDLEAYSKEFYRRFYFRPRIVFNYLKKIRSWRHLKIYFSAFLALLEWIFKKREAETK
ncbi:cobalamin B12-binding domain-containing protein [Candidatus Falkowbacteria bacterium]|nr:cobalamin B12-binding domain-containing protein [Candidatus Falkowbacteria bacterium]